MDDFQLCRLRIGTRSVGPGGKRKQLPRGASDSVIVRAGTPVRPSRSLLLAENSTEVRRVLTGFFAARVAVGGRRSVSYVPRCRAAFSVVLR